MIDSKAVCEINLLIVFFYTIKYQNDSITKKKRGNKTSRDKWLFAIKESSRVLPVNFLTVKYIEKKKGLICAHVTRKHNVSLKCKQYCT